MSTPVNLATAEEFHSEIARLQAEIAKLLAAGDRLESQLAQVALSRARLRLTDAERAAIADAADRYAQITPESAATAATLRGLLERMK